MRLYNLNKNKSVAQNKMKFYRNTSLNLGDAIPYLIPK